MCDCLRSLPGFDFKWAAIEQKLISLDVVIVFNALKSLGHCAQDKLKQLTQLTVKRLDKALNLLIVLEKVVRVNGELIFVQLPPDMEALVSAQAHATTDEEVAALCAAPAPVFTQAAVSNTSTTADVSADQPCASDSAVVTEPKANPKSSAESEAEVVTTFADSSESEPVSKDIAVGITSEPSADEPKANTPVVVVDTASAQTESVSATAAATTSVAQAVTKDLPVADTKPLATKVAAEASALHTTPAVSSLPVNQTAVVTNATPEEQTASKAEVSGVHNAEPVVQLKATPAPEDIPVLQAEPIEPTVSANVANGQQSAKVVTTQCNDSQTMTYVATAQNSAIASQKQGFASVTPSASSAAVVVTNSTVVSVAVSPQVPANGSPNQNFAPVPASGTQQYQAQFAVPQQYQPQFAAPSAPDMQSMQPACDQVVGDHPRDLQEVIDYIKANPLIYSHLLCNSMVDLFATAAQFYTFYANKSWMIGDSPIRNWKSVLYRAAGKGVDAKGNKRGWAITYFDAADVEAEQKARDLLAQADQANGANGSNGANGANGQGTFAQIQHQPQHSQSSLQIPALCQAQSQPLPLGQLSAMPAQQAVCNEGNVSYDGQQYQRLQSQSAQFQDSMSQVNLASSASASAGMSEFSDDEYDAPQIIETPEWLALDSKRKEFINLKMIQEYGEPPKIEDYPHYPNGLITCEGTKAYEKDDAEYVELVNRVRPLFIQKYKDVPIDQLI